MAKKKIPEQAWGRGTSGGRARHEQSLSVGTRQWLSGPLGPHGGEASPARLSRMLWSARETQGRGDY